MSDDPFESHTKTVLVALVMIAGLALAGVGAGFHSGTVGPSLDMNQSTEPGNDTLVEPGETVFISSAVNTTDDATSDYEGPGLEVTAPAGWDQDPVNNAGFTYKNNTLENGQWTQSGNPGVWEITYAIQVPAGASSGTQTVDAVGSAINNSVTKETVSDPLTLNVNQPPNVAIAANTTSISVGETIAFNNSSSSDPDGTITSNAWEFGDGTTATGDAVTNTYSSSGTFQVNLTVTDDDGATNNTSVTVNVNERPNVAISANTTSITEGETIAFDNATSSDPDGTITSNAWEFGDGTTATGAAVTNTYTDPGTFQVNLTVTDNDGATNTTSVTVTVNERPTVAINANKTTVNVSETIQFDNATSTDPDGTITSNAWEFGDGTTATGDTVTHSYASSGTFQVNLTVTDNDGATNTTSLTVTVNGPPNAAIALNNSQPNIGETVAFNNSSSSDGDGTIVSNSWEFGDGTTATGASVTNSYATNGTFQVNLTVTDNDGLTDTANVTVDVNDPPVAVIDFSANDTTYGFGTNNDAGFNGPDVPSKNESIEFTAVNSTDPDGTITQYTWSAGGNTLVGINQTVRFDTTGTVPGTLNVTDDDGFNGTQSSSITVQACRQEAIANFSTADKTIDLTEIQFAIAWWQTDSLVTGAGEEIQDMTEIQNRIADWVSTGSDVDC